MELANRASLLFRKMTSDEKKELVNLVLSNPRILNGSIEYDFKKPFSLFQNVVDLRFITVESGRWRVIDQEAWAEI